MGKEGIVMTFKTKKHILAEYFRAHGGIPPGTISVDDDNETVGNISVNGTWIGTFDYIAKKFIQLPD